jgi:hypothetical protein
MDAALWALIGITGGTAVVSSMIMNPGAPGAPGAGTQVLRARRTHVAFNQSVDDAQLSDMVYGETEDDADVVDSARVQAVVMTGLLAAIFGNLILEAAGGIGGVTILAAARNGVQVFTGMPPAGATFLWLLGVRHGALLGSKLLGAYSGGNAKT